jgi:uncharacterized protein (TIGR00296 family)
MTDKFKISEKDGQILVNTARAIITEYLENGSDKELDQQFQEDFSFKSGVFVTLKNSNGLRGCIGYPLPDKKLFNALKDASIAAAIEDPRFPPVKFEELDFITVEVTVLSPPTRIEVDDSQEYLSKIKVGQDGLIVKYGYNSGLLLPQVPIEYGWNEREYLEHACEKAGLPSDFWKNNEIEIQKFEGIVFKEKYPNGEIIQEKLLG